MSARATRREALRRGALAAGAALAAPALAGPAAARAQDDDPLALEEFLVEAIVIEQIAVLAYATAAGAITERPLSRILEGFERQEQVHATALRSALDSLGVDPPGAPGAPGDRQAIEDVETLDSERATELADLLEEIDRVDGRDEHLELLLRVEDEQIRFYLRQAPTLDPEDMLRTAVEIAACQAQHAVVLNEELGRPPADAVPDLPPAEA